MNRILARVENDHVLLEPILGDVSDAEIERLTSDVYRLFSDNNVVSKHPEKKLNHYGLEVHRFDATGMKFLFQNDVVVILIRW